MLLEQRVTGVVDIVVCVVRCIHIRVVQRSVASRQRPTVQILSVSFNPMASVTIHSVIQFSLQNFYRDSHEKYINRPCRDIDSR